MSPPHAEYGWLDDATIATGLGLVLLGLVVMGVFETLLGSTHFAERVTGVGVIIVHTSFSPHLRASVIALGFLILLVWGFSHMSRAILAHTSEEARSAKELAELIDVSQTSIYRRLEQLTEDGLVHETLRLDRSGNHFKLYRAAITHVSVDLENDPVQTRVDWHEDVSERFTRIWKDIRGDL